jgi:hypothetical protein
MESRGQQFKLHIGGALGTYPYNLDKFGPDPLQNAP